MLAGMSLGWALLFFTLYFLIILVVTRIRAELGPPVHDFHLIGPDLVMIEACGSRAFGGGDLGMIGLYWWFNRAYRGHPMPHGLEGLKMADRTRTRHREVFVVSVLAVEMAALAQDVALSIHPHPTLSETVKESAEVFFGTSTHIFRPKR